MIKLCIFDLDGTVLDTVKSIAYYANCALIKNGIEAIEVDMYKYLAGNGISRLIHNMLDYRNCNTPETYEKVFRDYDTAYNNDVTYKTEIFEGLLPVLDRIKEKGVRLAIVSNKPDFAAKTVVNKLYGEGYYDFVTGQTPGGVLKPDPTAVLDVISAMGVKKEECLYIGDTSTDMLTGKNAGLFTVGVLWGFRGRDELTANGADLIIDKPSQLYDCVLSFE